MLHRLGESRWAGPAVLALVSYLPLLLSRRGLVVADTKQYLYLDPGAAMSASSSLWDPDWALGTVTHQSIGYLWPMGPWFWLFETIGTPDWIAQRLWIGSILLMAGLGMAFLGRTFGWSRSAALVAAFVYLLSPYPLTYATRISVLVLPWAALPWLVALGVRALRRGGWRDPLAIGLVGTTVGSVNAASLFYAGLAVVIWFPFAVVVFREATWKQAFGTACRLGFALFATCLWWALALVVQSGHGADVLQFSESLDVVASGSPASEAWRGLGYWVFYGGDRTGSWVTAGENYTQSLWLLAVSFAMAAVTASALFLARWRYRAYFLFLAVLGLVLTIGFHPWERPGGVLSLVRDDVADTGLALALRSSPRALPLFLLAGAASIAVVLDSLDGPLIRRRVGVGVLAVAALAIQPLWTGSYVGTELARDETLPAAWQDAADHLNAGDTNYRVIVLPGADFSAHRWGNTIDHVLPGLIERSMAVRELVAFGPPASADLLIALDRGAQEGLFEPDAVAPVARLLGAGEVVVQSDLEYERYRLPRPDAYWAAISDASGFAEITEFGEPTPNVARDTFPLQDEVELALPPDLAPPPQVAALAIDDPLGILRVRPAAGALIVAGDGESLIDLALAGLLADDRVILYEAALTDAQLAAALEAGAEIVLTDGNRREARRWKTVRDNRGLTEQIGGDGLRVDQTDARLEVFPDAPVESFTTARQEGGTARATAYGNVISHHAEDRAYHAVDGDPTTAWRVAAFGEPQGETLTLHWDQPVATSTVRLVQPLILDPNRHIIDVDVSVNGSPFDRWTLGPASRTEAGETFELGVEVVESLVLRIDSASDGLSSVGFAEVDLGVGASLIETVVMAPALAARVIEAGGAPPATIIMSRERATEVRDDPETRLVREFELPGEAEFEVSGLARLSRRAPDDVLAVAFGLDDLPLASASDRMIGGAAQSAAMAIDGDESTAWMPPFGGQRGHWIEVALGREVTIGHVDLVLRADGRHSVPTVLDVETDEGFQQVAVPAVVDDMSRENATVEVRVPLTQVTTASIRLTVAEVRQTETINWYTASDVVMPVAIAEVRVPGISANPVRLADLAICRDDLIMVDGKPVSVRLVPGEAIEDDIGIEGCEHLALAAGVHRLETVAGRTHGIDVDRLAFRQSVDGAVSALVPTMEIVEHGRGSATVDFAGATEPFWLVLGESFGRGWRASVDGGLNLGEPLLVDGFANGWYIDPGTAGTAGTISLDWVPNRTVHQGFIVSILATLVLVALAWRRPGSAFAVFPAHSALGPRLDLNRSTLDRFLVAFVTAALTAAVSRWWIGLLAGVAAFVACSQRREARWLLGVVAVACVGLMSGYVFALQARYGGPHDGAWPGLWGKAHLLGWGALAMVVAELVIELRDQRRSA
ncbi:MAG: alpha-(1-_3)-arabinofuranosyltransferase family protein [Acidimicrobiales bacterium]|nr:alpha-(1->3)-arabinofuranosyltransferase family protein [Acidimicrobiales bacterium]